ncbi:YoaK family protein [Cupriavidus sp. CP313]
MSTGNPGAPPSVVDSASSRFLLSFVAGYVDVVGFTALFGLFTAHVTGNFVMIGIELSSPTVPVLLAKILALPTFVLAAVGTRISESRLLRKNRQPVPALLFVECMLLAIFMGLCYLSLPIRNADAPLAVLAGLSAVAAMGVQNVLARTALAEFGTTTVMTGNTTQLVIDLVDLQGASQDQRSVLKKRIWKTVPAIVGFVIGAGLGCAAYKLISFWCVLLPIGAIAFVSASIVRARQVSLSPKHEPVPGDGLSK